MKFQILFSRKKNKENIIILSFAEFAHSMVSVIFKLPYLPIELDPDKSNLLAGEIFQQKNAEIHHLYLHRSVWMTQNWAFLTSDHKLAGSNPAGGRIQLMTVQHFIIQKSLSLSPFHHLDMT